MSYIRGPILLTMVVMIVIALSGCSSGGTESSAVPASGASSPAEETAGDFASYPDKDLTLIITAAPGGGIDAYARAFVPFLEKHLPNGAGIKIENRDGASGVTGMNYYVNRVKPDGYTIVFSEPGGLSVQQLLGDVGFDILELSWLSQLRYEKAITVTHANSPIQSVDDLQGKFIPITGPSPRGTAGLSAFITFNVMGLDFDILATEGTADAVTATLRGDAALHHNNIGGISNLIDDGDFQPLFINGDERDPDYPDTPTTTQLGYPELANVGIFMAGFAVHGDAPEPIKQILADAMEAAMADPDFIKWSEEASRPIATAGREETMANVKGITEGYQPYIDLLEQLFSEQ